MSDIQPFIDGHVPAVPAESDAFRVELDGFDWGAYEARQELLDTASQAGESPRDIVKSLHSQDPETGVMLNNLHNLTLEGDPIAGLDARLAVMSKSVIKAGLPGLVFRGGVAAETKFQGINMRGADFTDSVVPGADFKGADLSGVSFVNSIVVGADFSGANVKGVDFAGAYLVDVKGLTPEQLTQVNLRGARAFVPAETSTGEADIASALASRFGNLGIDEDVAAQMEAVPVAFDQTVPLLQTSKMLRGLYGIDLILNNVDFTGSRMHALTLKNAMARKVVLREAVASGARITDSTMDEADLWGLWAPGSIWQDVSLRDANLTNANLVGSVFRRVDFRGAIGLNAKNTNLQGVVLEDCILPAGYAYDGFTIKAPEAPEMPQIEAAKE